MPLSKPELLSVYLLSVLKFQLIQRLKVISPGHIVQDIAFSISRKVHSLDHTSFFYRGKGNKHQLGKKTKGIVFYK